MIKAIHRILLISLIVMAAAVSAAPPPSFTYQSMLNIYFDDNSGLISVRDIDLAFAPEGQISAAVALVNSENTVVKKHKFYPDPRWRESVFARLTEVGPAEFKITEPGVYNLVFLIDGKPASRLPIKLEETSGGDDPFNPQKTFGFTGVWPIFSYLTTNKSWKDKPFPELHLWVGGKDLAPGQKKDMFNVVLKHKGETIAHSRETSGFITNKHYQRTSVNLYHPHTRQEIPNAIPFVLSDWIKNDGEYEIEAYRQSDGARIRNFSYTVKDNQIQALESTGLGYEPQVDYIVPRVTVKGASKYEFHEAIWLKSKPSN